MKQRLVIKGTILTYGEKWVVGNEDYSSILLSVANSWKSNNFSPQDKLTATIESWKSREFGKIKSTINGYTSDLHNISINYCFLKETPAGAGVPPVSPLEKSKTSITRKSEMEVF